MSKPSHSLVLFFLLIIPLYSQSISNRIEEILKDSLFNYSQIAIDIYDLSSDQPIYRKNEKLLFHPASNMKLFTAAAALKYLTPESKFNTAFFYDGEIDDSSLSGNLYVRGGFDPLFVYKDLDKVADQLKFLGVNNVQGNIYADVRNIDSLYFGRGWMWDDNPSSYMPYLSSLCINKNSVKIFFEPGELNKAAKIRFDSPTNYFSFEMNLVTTIDSKSKIKINRDWLGNKNHILIEGEISINESLDSASVNIINPQRYFLQLLKDKLNEKGISVLGNNQLIDFDFTADTLIVMERGIIDVVNEMNKQSDNLSAEMIIRKISNEKTNGSATAEKGLDYVDSLVAELGFNPDQFVFADGSGLSHYNLVSASLILELLKNFYKKNPDLYGYLYESLPIGGVDGTLEKRMNIGNAANNVRAKTGTISGVSALSGYLKSADNHLIAFSIIVQNYPHSAYKARKIQDEICNILAGYN